jgi:hypothetical protein
MPADRICAWLIAITFGLPGVVLVLGEALPAAAWAVLALAEWAGVLS